MIASIVSSTDDAYVNPTRDLKNSADKLLSDTLKIPNVNPFVLKASRDVQSIGGNSPISASSLQYTLDELNSALETYGRSPRYNIIRQDARDVAANSGLSFPSTPTAPIVVRPDVPSPAPTDASVVPNTLEPSRTATATTEVPVTSSEVNTVTSNGSLLPSSTTQEATTSPTSSSTFTSEPTGLPFQPTNTQKNYANSIASRMFTLCLGALLIYLI